jgi:hypothetical protein
VLDLSSIDLEEIANALADQNDYEHHWLINPGTGEIAFWTADTGIDGQTPVDLDELDLVVIDPLPSWVWYRDMTDFAGGITDERAGHRLARAIQAREPSAGSKTSYTRSVRTCCQCGTPSGMPVPGAVQCNGSLITRSLMTTLRIAFLTGTQIPPCPEPRERRWQWPPTWPASRAPPVTTPSPTCAASWPGALNAAWTRWLPAARPGAIPPVDAGDPPVQALHRLAALSVAAGFYRTCVINRPHPHMLRHARRRGLA